MPSFTVNVRPAHMRKRIPAWLTCVAVVGVTVILSNPAGSTAAGTPAAAPRPVAGSVVYLQVSGVDRAALADSAAVPPPVVPSAASPARLAQAEHGIPVVLTAPQATVAFDVVALTALQAMPDSATSWVRVREAGRWSTWYPMDWHGDDAPDPGKEGPPTPVAATTPLGTSNADGVQVRIDAPPGTVVPAGLTATLVNGGSSDADRVNQMSTASNTPAPPLVTRQQWGADESLVQTDPVVNDTVKVMFVHHTDTTNTYTTAQAFAQVRSVYLYHTKVRGWNDIGYNFVVDRFGRIFEGRRGSITQPIQGAHTLGFNVDSMGVSLLGSHTSKPPTSAALSGLTRVLGWKAAEFYRNPSGRSGLTSAGGSGNKYTSGTLVQLPTISAHRDVYSTDCPGLAAYTYLPWLRAKVTERMRAGLINTQTSAGVVNFHGSAITTSAGTVTAQRWWVTVRALCWGGVVRQFSGTSWDRLSATWELRDSAGQLVPPGAYQIAVTTRSPTGTFASWYKDVEIAPVPGGLSSGCRVQRTQQQDAISQAIATGQALYPDATSTVVTSVNSPLNALLGAPLSHMQRSPLLVTADDGSASAVTAELRRRSVNRVWFIGTPTAAVRQQLSDAGVSSVQVLGGSDRYAVSAAVARAMGSPWRTAMVANGATDQLAHLIPVAAAAAGTNRPVLLIPGASLGTAATNAIRDLRIASVVVVGSSDRISATAWNQLATLGVTYRQRVGASTPWETSVAIAKAFVRPVPGDHVSVVAPPVAGIAQAAIAASEGRFVFVVQPQAVPDPVAAWLQQRKPGMVTIAQPVRYLGPPIFRPLISSTS